MKLEDVIQHFGNTLAFKEITGMHHSNYCNWRKKGYIPIKTQMWLEEFTQGALKADFTHAPVEGLCTKQK